MAVIAKRVQYYVGQVLDVRAMLSWIDKYMLQGRLKRRYNSVHLGDRVPS